MTKHLTPATRRWITVVLTLTVALLSGHLMQSQRSETVALEPVSTPVDLPNPPAAASALALPTGLTERILETRAERKGSCDVRLQLDETPAGFLSVSLDAPCHANTMLTFQINELTANDVTDARGRWENRLPAFSEVSDVSIALEGGVTVYDRLRHEFAENQQHVVLAWTGEQTFRIRVDQTLDAASQSFSDDGLAGAFTRLGNTAGSAFEVFTFPSAGAAATGLLRISVDAEVTADNCGKTATTRAYQTGFLGTLRPTDISYTMPECSRIGEVVRLQNLFRDLRLALR